MVIWQTELPLKFLCLFFCSFLPREKNMPFYEEKGKIGIFKCYILFWFWTKKKERRLTRML